jgi:NhaP-type Na+/H+ or K+/H+ antiporter
MHARTHPRTCTHAARAPAQEVGAGIADFIIICLGSCVIGFLVPCLCTYVLKRAELRGHVVLELSVYLIMAYVPYVLAQVRSSLYLLVELYIPYVPAIKCVLLEPCSAS